MKEHTVKLSGYAKDRFLERFFAQEEGLDVETRRRLVTRSKGAMSSLRVRKAVLSGQRMIAPKTATALIASGVAPAATASPEQAPAALREPFDPPAQVAAPAPSPSPPVSTAAPDSRLPESSGSADPYAVKLVPVFQREGRDGLLARLGGIDAIDHLRQIAKAQQIVLPQALRAGEGDPDTLRAAIVDAVAKRVADRRAAAG